jgi:hypothetical protein
LGVGIHMGSLWSLEYLESNERGQNSLDWKPPYTIGNILKLRYLKWDHMIHLNTYNTSYGWKKGWESKRQFDTRPLKIENRPKLHVCRRHSTYLDKDYNFVIKLISIRGLHNKLWAFKVVGVLILGILGFPSWESWEKWHLGVTPYGQS